jgi:hypothetical protein
MLVPYVGYWGHPAGESSPSDGPRASLTTFISTSIPDPEIQVILTLPGGSPTRRWSGRRRVLEEAPELSPQ